MEFGIRPGSFVPWVEGVGCYGIFREMGRGNKRMYSGGRFIALSFRL